MLSFLRSLNTHTTGYIGWVMVIIGLGSDPQVQNAWAATIASFAGGVATVQEKFTVAASIAVLVGALCTYLAKPKTIPSA